MKQMLDANAHDPLRPVYIVGDPLRPVYIVRPAPPRLCILIDVIPGRSGCPVSRLRRIFCGTAAPIRVTIFIRRRWEAGTGPSHSRAAAWMVNNPHTHTHRHARTHTCQLGRLGRRARRGARVGLLHVDEARPSP